MSLYLKYRPKKVEELDLTNVREVIGGIFKSNKVSHAYLFTGPRGAGKTSASRILARIVNCEENKDKLEEPCGKCGACKAIENNSAVDIIEIDAASNRGIDDIRELKQKIRLAPSQLRKKVYIIDEVHMLTTEAFNALLKTLEEPPSHTMFVLCTTEAHKVPETIKSRCTQVYFTKATKEEMIRSLNRVVKGEGAKITEEAISYLASRVDGSFRDGVKTLDQLIDMGKKIEIDDVKNVLYGGVGESLEEFVDYMLRAEITESIKAYQGYVDRGIQNKYILTESMQIIRDSLVAKYTDKEQKVGIEDEERAVELVYLFDETLQKSSSSQLPNVIVEMMIIKWCEGGRGVKIETGGDEGDLEKTVEVLKSASKKTSDLKPKNLERKSEMVSSMNSSDYSAEISKSDISKNWKELLKRASNSYSLEALLSKTWPRSIEGDELIVEVMYDFHRQQLMTERFRSMVEDMVKDVFAFPLKCRFELGDRVSEISANELRRIGDDGNIGQEKEADNTESPQNEDDIVSVAEEIFIN